MSSLSIREVTAKLILEDLGYVEKLGRAESATRSFKNEQAQASRGADDFGRGLTFATREALLAGAGMLGLTTSAAGLTLALGNVVRQVAQAEDDLIRLRYSTDNQIGAFDQLVELVEEQPMARIFTSDDVRRAVSYASALGLNVDVIDALLPGARDLAAVMGVDLPQAYEALSRVVLTGQTKALQSVGVLITEEQVNERAVEMYQRKAAALRDVEKQAVMLSIAQERLSRFHGAERELALASSGSWRALGQEIGNTLQDLSGPGMRAATQYIQEQTARVIIMREALEQLGQTDIEGPLSDFFKLLKSDPSPRWVQTLRDVKAILDESGGAENMLPPQLAPLALLLRGASAIPQPKSGAYGPEVPPPSGPSEESIATAERALSITRDSLRDLDEASKERSSHLAALAQAMGMEEQVIAGFVKDAADARERARNEQKRHSDEMREQLEREVQSIAAATDDEAVALVFLAEMSRRTGVDTAELMGMFRKEIAESSKAVKAQVKEVERLFELRGTERTARPAIDRSYGPDESPIAESYRQSKEAMLDFFSTQEALFGDMGTQIMIASHALSTGVEGTYRGFFLVAEALFDKERRHLLDRSRITKAITRTILASELELIAEVAKRKAALAFAEGIWPPNPALIAKGLALGALAGTLGAAAASASRGAQTAVERPQSEIDSDRLAAQIRGEDIAGGRQNIGVRLERPAETANYYIVTNFNADVMVVGEQHQSAIDMFWDRYLLPKLQEYNAARRT